MEKYEVLQEIGKGSFGRVFKVRRRTDDRTLVWKELNYGKMSEKEKQMLVSEVNILQKLKHPHITRYYDRVIDKEHARLYIVMEYCAGGDLAQRIRKRKKLLAQQSEHKQSQVKNIYFEEDQAWKMLAQLTMALLECHRGGSPQNPQQPQQQSPQNPKDQQQSQKILHRDLKPGNVFFDSDENVKLGDFGLSRMMGDESVFAYTHVGTPYYMSPELIAEQRYNDKSDIWAAGCVLYEMVALKAPFEATNQLQLAEKIKTGKIQKIPDFYSEALWAVIMCMLQVDQRKRPSVEDLMKHPRICYTIKHLDLDRLESDLKRKEKDFDVTESKILKQQEQITLKKTLLNEKHSVIRELTAKIESQKKMISQKQAAQKEILKNTHQQHQYLLAQKNASTKKQKENYQSANTNATNNNRLVSSDDLDSSASDSIGQVAIKADKDISSGLTDKYIQQYNSKAGQSNAPQSIQETRQPNDYRSNSKSHQSSSISKQKPNQYLHEQLNQKPIGQFQSNSSNHSSNEKIWNQHKRMQSNDSCGMKSQEKQKQSQQRLELITQQYNSHQQQFNCNDQSDVDHNNNVAVTVAANTLVQNSSKNSKTIVTPNQRKPPLISANNSSTANSTLSSQPQSTQNNQSSTSTLLSGIEAQRQKLIELKKGLAPANPSTPSQKVAGYATQQPNYNHQMRPPSAKKPVCFQEKPASSNALGNNYQNKTDYRQRSSSPSTSSTNQQRRKTTAPDSGYQASNDKLDRPGKTMNELRTQQNDKYQSKNQYVSPSHRNQYSGTLNNHQQRSGGGNRAQSQDSAGSNYRNNKMPIAQQRSGSRDRERPSQYQQVLGRQASPLGRQPSPQSRTFKPQKGQNLMNQNQKDTGRMRSNTKDRRETSSSKDEFNSRANACEATHHAAGGLNNRTAYAQSNPNERAMIFQNNQRDQPRLLQNQTYDNRSSTGRLQSAQSPANTLLEQKLRNNTVLNQALSKPGFQDRQQTNASQRGPGSNNRSTYHQNLVGQSSNHNSRDNLRSNLSNQQQSATANQQHRSHSRGTSANNTNVQNKAGTIQSRNINNERSSNRRDNSNNQIVRGGGRTTITGSNSNSNFSAMPGAVVAGQARKSSKDLRNALDEITQRIQTKYLT